MGNGWTSPPSVDQSSSRQHGFPQFLKDIKTEEIITTSSEIALTSSPTPPHLKAAPSNDSLNYNESNKEKLFELANTPVNVNCSRLSLKYATPKIKLETIVNSSFHVIFQSSWECFALGDLGAKSSSIDDSIHMEKLSLPQNLLLLYMIQ
ncbi:hypothetical protein Tco_1577995 [Tanacetum coccineum]